MPIDGATEVISRAIVNLALNIEIDNPQNAVHGQPIRQGIQYTVVFGT